MILVDTGAWLARTARGCLEISFPHANVAQLRPMTEFDPHPYRHQIHTGDIGKGDKYI